MLQILKAIFEWFIIIAIIYGVISEIIHQYTYNGILAITPIVLPLLLGGVWIYVKITDYYEKKKKETYQRQD